MKKFISKLFSRNAPYINNNSIELDYTKLPILTAEQLIQFTGQQNRIRSIKRIIKIDDKYFETLYLSVIHKFAELVQLMPASQAHHHAVPGGLFIHTLEVIEYAIRLRQQYKLPAFAEQDIQEKEHHAWSYAVFVAAILHDIGKRITMCVFVRDDGKVHSPFDEFLSDTSCRHYKLIFQDPKFYHLHDVLGLTMIDIVPAIGKTFLFNHLHIVKEMMAYIHGNKQESGMIGEIIRKADQYSTGKSLAHLSTRKFKGANLENIGERLMTQLRQMIASNDFIINKANANIYTSKEGFTYCVAKVVVDAIRDEMIKQDIVDIPQDNNRIFDTLQEYGFVETNIHTGRSIHTIRLHKDDTVRVFTVLKFMTKKLFRVEPPPFDGVIEEVLNKESVNVHKNAPISAQEHQLVVVEQDHQQETTSGERLLDNETTNVDCLNNMVQKTEVVTKEVEPITVEINKVEQNSLAYDFLNWCREKIKDKSIIINESNGMIQKVSYKGSPVIALVTPRVFYEFATSINMPNPKDKSSFSKIQSAIHKEKLNIPSYKGQIHIYKIKKSINNPLNGNIKIRHYLFEIDTFVQGDNEISDIIEKIPINSNLIGV
ncbi:MobH family relaxase [Pasteurella atlantica]|uniref:MobH family relaxase n=2 Tax=Pasteurellaceae TaxID=712 RepID=A0ACC6HKT6_9PAST|nr:MobH family relaxase [Pasteurella atlantica]MDP8051501.1 MobH family relaxase [Pasteurella atlantica]MDP8104920.1 MobH family relaxase [Pasteurella atlantica]MDP8148294.1 MobH family relaxase [Pasteurella atlantica]